ncbi:MAG: hypothetical protein AAF901_01495 [Bacteroidota bacterium]
MPKQVPLLLAERIAHFLSTPQPGRIMFCKRYKIRDHLEIGAGAILNLRMAWPGLVEICRKLYQEDKSWLVGDVVPLSNQDES